MLILVPYIILRTIHVVLCKYIPSIDVWYIFIYIYYRFIVRFPIGLDKIIYIFLLILVLVVQFDICFHFM